jgi:hypothetical protein
MSWQFNRFLREGSFMRKVIVKGSWIIAAAVITQASAMGHKPSIAVLVENTHPPKPNIAVLAENTHPPKPNIAVLGENTHPPKPNVAITSALA